MQNNYIAYIAKMNSEYGILLYDTRTGQSKLLTQGTASRISVPYWSPDAKRISYIGQSGIIFVLDINTRQLARIDQTAEGTLLDWSPDGTRLVYTKGDNIIIYELATFRASNINRPGVSDAQWFPDGDSLLFQAPDASGISQLYSIGLKGGNARQITTNTEGRLNNVRLSPDGTFALYTTPGASISLIYTVDIGSGRSYSVPGGPLAKNYNPEWSPSSLLLAYSATAQYYAGYYSQIRIADRLGANDHTISVSSCYATPVSWSPDGSNLAYLSGCGQDGFAREIRIINLYHPAPVRVVNRPGIISLAWSPAR